MSPDTWDNIRRIAAFVVYSTMGYILFLVAWSWMKRDEGELDREAEAFQAGYAAGHARQMLGVAWQAYLDERGKKRDRPS